MPSVKDDTRRPYSATHGEATVFKVSTPVFRWAVPKLDKRRGNPAAASALDRKRECELRDQEGERAWRRCRSRRQALPEPSKWLPATMILDGDSEVYLKLSGKWTNIGGKLLKVTPMQPESRRASAVSEAAGKVAAPEEEETMNGRRMRVGRGE